jgi:hypothetical protein
LSHIVEIQTQIRDPAAVQAAARRLGLPGPVQGTAKLYSGQATGLIVQLPGWRYALVCNTATGEIKYDNFNGIWGDQARLGSFLQAYAIEKAKIEARMRGHGIAEQQLADGSVKLTVQIGGGAS